MRCYHFCHVYLSDIQHGIQSAHAQMELMINYKHKSSQHDDLYTWALSHKTMICLNGGNTQGLLNIQNQLSQKTNPYAWSSFYEDSASLNSTITNIAIIVPEVIYNEASMYRQSQYTADLSSYSTFDQELISLLSTSKLI